MVKAITTKREQQDFEHYVNSIVRDGLRPINYVYKNPSGAKVQAWNDICREADTNHGSYLTVTGASSSFFSTGYLIFTNNSTQPVTEVYFVRHTPYKRVEYKLNAEQISLLSAKGIKSFY